MKSIWIAMPLVALLAGAACAASSPLSPMEGLSGLSTSTIPVNINARSMEYNRARNLIIASGNVVITREGEELRADSLQLNTATHEVEARGHVVFTKQGPVPSNTVAGVMATRTNALAARPASVWKGEYLRYNLDSGAWKTGTFESYFDPFFVRAAESGMADKSEYVLRNAVVTTCTNAYPDYHYSLSCRKLRVSPGNWMKGRGTVVRLGGIPVFYTPYWYRSLSDRSVGFSAEAGYRNRMGGFLLTSTKYWMSPTLRGVTQLDYRTKRGPAIGQELGWRSSTSSDKGRIYGYYLNDDGIKDDTTYSGSTEIDEQRYRLRFQDFRSLSSRDYFLADATYLSDPFVLQDFFDDEYRNSYQPQNYATLTHRGEESTLGLSVHGRLNDFYTAVERLPEVTFDVNRQEVGDTPFYYESRNSAAYLRKDFGEGEGLDDFSASRADTAHTLYWPTREFGFLNVTPRVGYRGTYYSETVDRSTVTQVVNVVTTNFVAGAGGVTNAVLSSQTRTNVSQVVTPLGSDVRSLLELGFETSFRMFKVLSNDENLFGQGLRHVVEPYANYTFIPEPDLTPDHLYQFDSVDTLGKNDSVTFGMHNRLQTKRDMRVDDIMDVNLFTTYNFEDEVDRPFSDIGMNSEFRLASWCQLYADATYNLYDSTLDTFNVRTHLAGDSWRADVEHRYLLDQSNLLAANVAYAPNKRWEFGVYDRYEFESSQLEEQGVFVTRTLDCLAVRVGGSYLPSYTLANGSERGEDYRASLQLWLTAFPGIRVGNAPRY